MAKKRSPTNIDEKIKELEKELDELRTRLLRLLDNQSIIITKVDNGYVINFIGSEGKQKKVIEEKVKEYPEHNQENSEQEALRDVLYSILGNFDSSSRYYKKRIKVVLVPGDKYTIKKEDKKNLETIKIWKEED